MANSTPHAPAPAVAGPSTSSTHLSLSSAYHQRPNQRQTHCLDITSFKFLPDDEERVEIVLRAIMGENQPPSHSKAPATVHLNYPTVSSADETGVPLAEAPGAQPSWDEDRFLRVPDLVSKFPPEKQIIQSIVRRPSITFLLLSRPQHSKKRWEIPNFETAADFLNDAICSMYNIDAPFSEAYDRTGRWGRITTILLKSVDPVAIDQFRKQLTCWSYKGMDYDTFPRDIATTKPDLSILLRNNMKSFQLEVLPKILFIRNKEILAGHLCVLSSKSFPEGETSHKGESKENWRWVDMKGDDQVLRCLRFIPESSPFKLGVETVQIRGGLRPQEHDESSVLGKRPWKAAVTPPVILDPGNGTTHPAPPSNPPATRGGPPKRGRGGRRGNFTNKK